MRKSFTLVEMIVAMAVSAIIVAATYASYDLVKKQYARNIDVAEMHNSGRAIMQVLEREIRMAGFEYRDTNAKITYGAISSPLVIKDSGNKCCDEITVIYDYFDEDTNKVERIRSRFWTQAYTSNKGTRYYLYNRKDILGKNNAILAKPILGSQDLMADFLEDLQIVNITTASNLFAANRGGYIRAYDPVNNQWGLQIMNQTKSGSRLEVYSLAYGNGLLYTANNGGYIRAYDPANNKWGLQMLNQTKSGSKLGVSALAFKTKRTGQESLVTINLTLRTRNEYDKDRQFQKKDYLGGNFKINKTDKYMRDTFSSKVLVRNLML